MKNFFYILFVFTSLRLSAQEHITFSKKSWSDVLIQAQKEKRLVYLDCYTSWCAPCKRMEKEVFSNEEVATFYNRNFINYKMDMESDTGLELVKRYKVHLFPTHLFINGYGELVHRSVSFKSSKAFIELGKEALNSDTQTSKIEKEYINGNRSPGFLIRYVKYLKETGQEYAPYFDEYLKALPESDLVKDKNIELLFLYTSHMNSYAFDVFSNEIHLIRKFYKPKALEFKYFTICVNSMKQAARTKDEELLGQVVELYKEKIDHKYEDQAVYELIYIPYYRLIKDVNKMHAMMLLYINQFIIDEGNINLSDQKKILTKVRKKKKVKELIFYEGKPGKVKHKFNPEAKQLLSFSKIIFYDNVENEAIQRDAIHWVELALRIEEKFEYYNLLIKWYDRLNEVELVKRNLEKAIALAKKERYQEEDYRELLEIRNKVSEVVK